MESNELRHWGIKGMKWGVRRFQNKDGSLTPAGKKRYDDDGDSGSGKGKSDGDSAPRRLTDQELRDKVARLELERRALDLERQIRDLSPQQVSTGKQFVSNVTNKVIVPALMDAGKRVATDFLNKKGRELLGLDKTDIDPSKALADSVKELGLKKKKIELDEWFNNRNKPATTNNTNESKPKNEEPSTPKPKSEPKVESVKAEIIPPSKEPFKTSNSNSRSVHDVYNEMFQNGKGTVRSLTNSGYTMTPLSKLESNNPIVSQGKSASDSLLTRMNGWTMRSLEDIEK